MFALRRMPIAVGAVLGLVLAGTATASAATTYTAKIGSTVSGSGTYTAASTTTIVQTDTTTNVTDTCTSAAFGGAVPVLGSGLSGTRLLTGTTSTWRGCTGPAGLAFTYTQSGIWSFDATAPTTAGGVTRLAITGILMKVATSGCSFSITGSIDATFTNSSQLLSVAAVAGSGHVLTVSGVSGCFGIYANGHTWKIVGSFKISAKSSAAIAGALTITSP